MRTSTVSFTCLLFFFFTLYTITAKNLISNTCNLAAQHDPLIRYKFCLTSLQAAPGSHRANLSKLGLISIKLLQHNVTSTRKHIKHLLRNKKLDKFVRACLEDCSELYSDAVYTVKLAMESYKLKQYADANVEVSSVLDASITCEDGFMERKGTVSPLTKRNGETRELSAISLSIINMQHA